MQAGYQSGWKNRGQWEDVMRSEEKVVSDLKVSEQAQFLEQEKEGFEAIRAAFSQNDKEAAVHSMEALISQAVQKKLNIVMIQELNYRFFYLLQDLLQKGTKYADFSDNI